MEETRKKAEEFLNELINTDSKIATVVGLYGDLGSGKTTFTKIVGELLNVKETIQSPTFVIQKIYNTANPKFRKFYHLDLYRIEDPQELKVLHLTEVFQDPNNLVFIEWPERGAAFLPNDMIKLTFEVINEDTRKIKRET